MGKFVSPERIDNRSSNTIQHFLTVQKKLHSYLDEVGKWHTDRSNQSSCLYITKGIYIGCWGTLYLIYKPTQNKFK